MAIKTSQKAVPTHPAGSHSAIESPSRSFLGKSMTINGKITSGEQLTIDGKIKGNINITNSLNIGKNGYIKGEINAEGIRVDGKVEGNITASDHVRISSTGHCSGSVKSEKLAIEEGAVFKGKINVDGQ
ncbi:MAG: bactofilin family protein [Candidatus Omnitrophota bacterium]